MKEKLRKNKVIPTHEKKGKKKRNYTTRLMLITKREKVEKIVEAYINISKAKASLDLDVE